MSKLTDLQILLQLFPNKKWDYYLLSQNSSITYNIVKHYSKKPWNYDFISNNPCITPNIALKHYKKLKNYFLDSTNPNITWDIVKENINKKWDYNKLSFHPNITWDIVKENPDKPWNYEYLSYNKNITQEIIVDNPDIPWDYRFLSLNNLTTCKIKEISIPKEYIFLSDTWEIIKNNLDNLWDYTFLTNALKFSGPNPWDYDLLATKLKSTKNINNQENKYLSLNNNLTWEIIFNNPQIKWDFKQLSINQFNNRKYNWSTKLHKYYYKKEKKEIIHLIWVWKKGENILYLPREIMHMILSILY